MAVGALPGSLPHRWVVLYLDQLGGSSGEAREKLGEQGFKEITSLSKEGDPELFLEGFKAFAQRLQRAEKLDAAVLAFQALSQVSSFTGKDPGEFPQNFSAITQQAQRELEAMTGGGALGPRLEFLGKQLIRQTTDPWMVLGFGAASSVYKGVKYLSLAKIISNPLARSILRTYEAELLASGLGLALEAPAFVFSVKAGKELWGEKQNWDFDSLLKENFSTALTLFALRGAGALSREVLSSLRSFPLSQASRFEKISAVALPQAFMGMGILFSRRFEAALGLRSHLEPGMELAEALATLVQFNLGGAFGDRLLGPRFRRWQIEMDLRTQQLTAEFPLFRPTLSPEGPAAADFIFKMAGDDEGGGSKPKPKLTLVHDAKVSREGPGTGEAAVRRGQRITLGERIYEARHEIHEAQQLFESVTTTLEEMVQPLEVFLIHRAMTRGTTEGFRSYQESLQEKTLAFVEGLSAQLALGRKTLEKLNVLRFVTVKDSVLNRDLNIQREALRLMLVQGAGALALLQTPLSTLRAFLPLKAHLEKLKRGPNPVEGGTTLSLGQEIFLSKATGILVGILAKEPYRLAGALPPHPPQPARDHDTLLELLHSFQDHWDAKEFYSCLMKTQYFGGPHSAREVLRAGGSWEKPFESWFRVHLPFLVAAHQGEWKVLMDRLAAVEEKMDPEMRQVTFLSAYWLSKVMTGRGEISTWIAEARQGRDLDLFEKDLSQDIFDLSQQEQVISQQRVQALGEEGPWAIFGHGFYAFLRHPFSAVKAMDEAAQAPREIREEALALTGALLGAFHGHGIFTDPGFEVVMDRGNPTEAAAFHQHKIQIFQRIRESIREEGKGFLQIWKSQKAAGKPGRVLRLVGARPPAGDAKFKKFEEKFSWGFAQATEEIQDLLNETALHLQKTRYHGVKAEVFAVFEGGLDASEVKLANHYRDLEALFPEKVDDKLQSFGETLLTLLVARSGLERMRGIFSNYLGLPEGARFSLTDQEALQMEMGGIEVLLGLPHQKDFSPWEARPFTEDEIFQIQEGALGVGRTLPPKVPAPFFQIRSDRSTLQAVVKNAQELSVVTPSVESLMEIYFHALGAHVVPYPNRSLADQASFSGLLGVVTPAYLLLHRENPGRAYHQLEQLRVSESIQVREAWRTVTYLALKLLEGTPPGDDLLMETLAAFHLSPMSSRLHALLDLRAGDNVETHRRLKTWEKTSDPRDRSILGIKAFLETHEDPKKFPPKTLTHPQDPDQIAERVAGLLLHAARKPRAARTP